MKKVPWMCLTDYWKSQKKNYPTRKNKIKRLKKKKKEQSLHDLQDNIKQSNL